MYSFKEKQKHFSELQNPDAASLDLKLLTQKTPSHPLLRKFSRNPQRYANEILYQLLDVAERDEIRNNRRPPVSKSNVVNGSQSSKKETEILLIEKSEKVENVTSESSDPDQQDKISDVTDQIVEAEEHAVVAEERAEEAEERAEEAELRVEEAEERAEEAELRAEEAEERADNAEAALEQEKKKVVTTSKPVSNPKVKSKSGKSTQKSTGTTSPTRKSRQPRSSTTTGS
ncbi:alanine-zipper protein [Bacteroides nordii]|jgi:chromosome segregation ATPase|uniref:alanine-zipper protein n=1 Tax=Bacteroides nordii TaxID=291645 RepID=UPI00241C2564|nr:alanine-zipper protein [Bacteroides nordii]